MKIKYINQRYEILEEHEIIDSSYQSYLETWGNLADLKNELEIFIQFIENIPLYLFVKNNETNEMILIEKFLDSNHKL